ncbi:hypothetical protein MAPG_10520 [Magnaporthiopsis poae ATCC 64411]|uniref:AAA+ ATPase domain-containing protein n=1 Tax=Magnaporthiopsis poae (strain ATCC 64411 / 73-15) TaxID=644358 RepID=A0A0C4ECT5_MAGP6|nr:hypothetical protein MAPG_10520 [Magnaporthiopsis poae ATCC 64411]
MAESPAGYERYMQTVNRHASENNKHASEDNKGSGSTDKSFNGRFFDVTEHWLSPNEPGECVPTGQISNTAVSRRRYGENSLLLRRIIVPQKQPKLQLEIQSTSLQKAFRAITGDLASLNVNANPIVIQAPYYELYHFREELKAAFDATKLEGLKKELQLFFDFEDEHMSRALNLREIEDHLQPPRPTIQFEHLWALFKPHELILLQTVTPASSTVQSCGVLEKYWIDQGTDGLAWFIQVRHMDFDGERFGVVQETFKFPAFNGVLDVDSLPAYPLSFCTDQHGVRKALAETSKTYIELCKGVPASPSKTRTKGCLRDYHGPAWVQRPDSRYGDRKNGMRLFDPPEDMISGRVLVDPVGFIRENPGFRVRIVAKTLNKAAGVKGKAADPATSVAERQPILDPETLEGDDLICFPAMVAGYSLSTKHCGNFHVGSFRDVSWEEDEPKSLFRNSEKMRHVQKIAASFSYQSHSFQYSIGGKGRGLVFLFYGPSGTGKTLTAECVAENLRQPLYRVSGSDLGSDISRIEASLQQTFNRIARWEAILLLDEADAFMAERGDDSLERNSLVSILLRMLEYQSGIVILTTNREDNFDKAFHTRIHVTISFPPVTQKEREIIWRNQASAKRVGARTASLSDEEWSSLSELKLDGRSIKNVFHVAGLWTGSDGGEDRPISLDDIKSVLQIALGNASKDLKRQLEEFVGVAEEREPRGESTVSGPPS